MEVDFPGSPPGNYWILDTDYDNYNVVYSCNKRGDSLYIFSWINTRSRNPPPEIVSKICFDCNCLDLLIRMIFQVEKGIDALHRNNIPTIDDLVNFSQEDCDYEAEPSCWEE